MSKPSNWPLPPGSIRYLVPKPLVKALEINFLSRGLLPLAFGYYQNAIKHKVTRTHHDDNLLIFCCAGKGYVETSEYQSEIKANDLLLLPKSVPHHYFADSQFPWSIYWAHIDGHLFSQFLLACSMSPKNLSLSLPEHNPISQEFSQLMECRNSSLNLNGLVYASNILKKILAYAAALHNQRETVNNDIPAVVEFMNDHIEQQLSLGELANHVGLSKFHLIRQFQQQFGSSPIQFFLNLKIKHACLILDRSQSSIKHIAAQLGYDDPYYFSRLFKKVMGISPKQYRLSRHGH